MIEWEAEIDGDDGPTGAYNSIGSPYGARCCPGDYVSFLDLDILGHDLDPQEVIDLISILQSSLELRERILCNEESHTVTEKTDSATSELSLQLHGNETGMEPGGSDGLAKKADALDRYHAYCSEVECGNCKQHQVVLINPPVTDGCRTVYDFHCLSCKRDWPGVTWSEVKLSPIQSLPLPALKEKE